MGEPPDHCWRADWVRDILARWAALTTTAAGLKDWLRGAFRRDKPTIPFPARVAVVQPRTVDSRLPGTPDREPRFGAPGRVEGHTQRVPRAATANRSGCTPAPAACHFASVAMQRTHWCSVHPTIATETRMNPSPKPCAKSHLRTDCGVSGACRPATQSCSPSATATATRFSRSALTPTSPPAEYWSRLAHG